MKAHVLKSTFALVSCLALGAFGAAGCGEDAPPPKVGGLVSPVPSTAVTAPVERDPIGARPVPAEPKAFELPVPSTYTRPNGLTVWLMERHELPLVAVALAIRSGSVHDPKGREGLASATFGMLDEGAGKRNALDLAKAIDALGASLGVSAHADYSEIGLSALTKNIEPAFAIFADVVVRPKFAAHEWTRVKKLWMNQLEQREKEPKAVASIAESLVTFGADHPYGHPVSGLTTSAPKIELAQLKKFYAEHVRPDRATLVVVGDVNRAMVDKLLDANMSDWKAPKTAAPETPKLPEPATPKRRVVLVDRKDAPQAMIAVVRPGVAAGDDSAALLSRVNAALGGSFTSRLNQDLREEHGWTYGARSGFSFTRGRGIFSAGAAVFSDKTGDALAALVKDVNDYATNGPTEEEWKKTRLLARTDTIGVFESVDQTATFLARNAGVGLPADYEAKATKRRDELSFADMKKLAAQHLGGDFVIVVVGPEATVMPQLKAAGFNEVEKLSAKF